FSIRYLDPFKKSPPWFLNPYNHPARHRAAFQIIQRPVEIAKFPPLDGNRLDFSCSGKRDDFFQFSQAAEMGALNRNGAQDRSCNRQLKLAAEQADKYQSASLAHAVDRKLRRFGGADKIDGAKKRMACDPF